MTSLELHTFRISPGATDLMFNWEYTTLLDEGAYLVEGKLGAFETTIRFDPTVGFSGGIQTAEGPFTIKPITPTLSSFNAFTDQTGTEPSESSTPDVLDDYNWEFSEYDFCAAEQDVLFVRSSTADGVFPFTSQSATITNFQDYVNAVTNRANRTLINSEIGSKSINAIVHDTTLDITFTGSTSSAVVAELHGNPDLQQLRQDNDADVVVYYTGPVQHAAPTAGVETLNVDYGNAYIMANMLATSSPRKFPTTFTHEIGHINGAAHEKSHFFNDPNSNNRQVTQVSDIEEPADRRISYYSNPEVPITYPRPYPTPNIVIPTGTIMKNNAIIVSNRFCTIAELEQPDGFHAIAATAWPNGYPLCYSTIQLEAQVFSGNTGGLNNGPYTYDWSYRAHPTPTQPFISFSSQANPVFSIPNSNHLSYILRLTITDQGTGEMVTDDLVIGFLFCQDYARSSVEKTQALNDEESDLWATSNKTTSSEQIHFEVYDMSGRLLLKSDAYQNEIPNLLRNYLPSGIYVLKEANKGRPTLTSRKIWID